MTGWFIAFVLAGATFLALLLLARLPRAAREITAAALLLGLAGYAWQGNPALPGAPRKIADARGDPFDEKLAEQRRGLAERYGPAAQWLMLSDGLGWQGKTKESANVLLSGLRQQPDDANLWLGLGNALVAHGEGVLSPAAEFSFRRALALDPEGPAPRYFYGLALARAGQLQGARALWAPLAAGAPAGSAVKAELEANIARIDAMLAAQGGAPAP
ncbi:cytochrome c-type biogenesis protein CcmH/NrfG [Sphingobium sp. OAS761]|uniref:tetratricopeptide repeat protein n=1 Tax=Sphingobium sp. OAS761 TaxID=2817901 RepID=UPI00209CD4D1|nr:cytochrome C biosynthesis protein [Sphingobium sp. OAS761]MCP1470247.1 cytochrome c-type biogenesis protein CcmH/NrfG [Sphingobium sp. OAS761]